jgi:hypothetical protein
MDDGQVFEATVDQRDYRRWDLTRPRYGWPKATDAPFLVQSFVTAAALVRQGDVDGDPATVMERIVFVDDLDTSPVVPTDAGLGPA